MNINYCKITQKVKIWKEYHNERKIFFKITIKQWMFNLKTNYIRR